MQDIAIEPIERSFIQGCLGVTEGFEIKGQVEFKVSHKLTLLEASIELIGQTKTEFGKTEWVTESIVFAQETKDLLQTVPNKVLDIGNHGLVFAFDWSDKASDLPPSFDNHPHRSRSEARMYKKMPHGLIEYKLRANVKFIKTGMLKFETKKQAEEILIVPRIDLDLIARSVSAEPRTIKVEEPFVSGEIQIPSTVLILGHKMPIQFNDLVSSEPKYQLEEILVELVQIDEYRSQEHSKSFETVLSEQLVKPIGGLTKFVRKLTKKIQPLNTSLDVYVSDNVVKMHDRSHVNVYGTLATQLVSVSHQLRILIRFKGLDPISADIPVEFIELNPETYQWAKHEMHVKSLEPKQEVDARSFVFEE
ncbi:hypothetical protein EDD86DRAFT_200499 [Gorgonomyces haynaldii]|nr:hypothetical protein EDD86DRAFT_200499 [Gorgonomyces haynaldii]